MDVKRAREALLAQGQHTSIDAIRIALGNTGSKTTIQRYLKELEEDEGASLTRAGSLSDTMVARLAARLHEEAQALVDQQAQSEIARLGAELATAREQLSGATAALCAEQEAHAGTRVALHQRDLDVERLTQQVGDQTERLAEQEGFRLSLEAKLVHARDALEHFRTAAREQREQEAHRHEQQVQQVQAELRQANQTAIVRQNEITQLNRDNARLVAEATATTRLARDQQAHGEALQSALNRALTDRARAQAERDAAQSAADARAAELLQVREARDSLRADLTRLAAQLEAQQQLLVHYRLRLGGADAAG
ncbi:DNA-binding protein [Paraburkholderia youngii]|uniref:DNA-binding protein n=1 Tax=Paraburkholderia youngii TaxID=2782701 RepID=UPI0020CE2C8B|nr:DNA-binding protein [Paraburkholderia youngii]